MREATYEDILHVLQNTQQVERDGLNAVLWGGFNEYKFANILDACSMKYCWCTKNGDPVVIGGLWFKSPAVGEAWMFGTDRWNEVVIRVTSDLRKIARRLLETELRRLEVYSIEAHDVAHQWYERGLKMKGPVKLYDYGVNGETFYLYSLTRSGL